MSVDEMISLHRKKENEEDLMLNQYLYRRGKFLAELKEKLKELNINPAEILTA